MTNTPEVRHCGRCGARLARYNDQPRCGPCQTKARESLLRPPSVPRAFWDIDQMRDALATWHLGRVILAYRTHPFHGKTLTQELVGSWLGITQTQLSRMERGRAPEELSKLIRHAQTLSIPIDLLWFKLPEHRRAAGADQRAGQPVVIGSRTTVLAGPRQGISTYEGSTLQQSGEHILKLFLHLDDELGGDSLYLPLSQYVARMAVNVRRNPSDGLSAFGQLHQMAGWLALDASRHGAAKRHLATAVQVGHEAGDPGLAASAMAYMSLQETYRGRLKPALSLAQAASDISPYQLTPLTRAMLGTRLARAHAGVANDTECLRILEQVSTDFNLTGNCVEPPYVSYVDDIEILAQRGACYLDLGMVDEAGTSLNKAIELLDEYAPGRVRDRVHYMSRLAKCHLLDGEPERAGKIGRDAVELCRAIGSSRVADRLKELVSSLGPFGQIEAVRDFKELLRSTFPITGHARLTDESAGRIAGRADW